MFCPLNLAGYALFIQQGLNVSMGNVLSKLFWWLCFIWNSKVVLSPVLSIYKMRIKQFDCGAIDLHCIMVWPCMASYSAAIDQFLTAVIGVFNWQCVPSEVYCIRALLYSSTTVDFHPLKNKVKVTFIEHDPYCYTGRGKQGGNSHGNSPLHH